MLGWALLFLIVAIVAGALGLSGIAGAPRKSPGSCLSWA